MESSADGGIVGPRRLHHLFGLAESNESVIRRAAWIIRAERLPYTGAGSCPHPRECGKGPALHIVPGVLTPVLAKHSNDLKSLDAFISASKQLEPIPQFKATAKPGEFLEGRFSQSF
jgi:hypothetical protein